jgi:hypothetical protein
MYIHMFCTISHCSMTSDTVLSLTIQFWTLSLNGALYLQVKKPQQPHSARLSECQVLLALNQTCAWGAKAG